LTYKPVFTQPLIKT